MRPTRGRYSRTARAAGGGRARVRAILQQRAPAPSDEELDDMPARRRAARDYNAQTGQVDERAKATSPATPPDRPPTAAENSASFCLRVAW